MIIKSAINITEKEGYEAMIYMLTNYWRLTGSNDLTDILSGAEYVEKDTPADSAFWHYWLEAVEQVKKQGFPPLKSFK
jgi:hypothetical protein